MSNGQVSVKERLQSDLTTAMKARDEVTTSTIRMLLAAITNAEVAGSEAIELDATLLHKDDAERFDGEALVFSVLFTPQAKGQHSIAAEVDFAVCGDAACGPVTEAVQLAFEVGCHENDTGLC